MELRQIGDSDLICSALGFGTWEMGSQYGPIDVKEASHAVNVAIEHGITLFDTAEVYGPYISEEILAKALGAKRKNIILVSKVGFEYSAGSKVTGRNSKYDHIIEHAHGCLKRLDTDFLDLLLIHWPDHDTPFEESISALEKLKEDGKIRHYGVSNFTPEMMEECEKYGHISANQVGYHMFDRRMESGVLPFCKKNNIGFMAYGTLGFGLLSGTFTKDTEFIKSDWRSNGFAFKLPLFQAEEFEKEINVSEKLKNIAQKYGKSLPQMAIAWTLGHPDVSVGLVGVRNEKELKENASAVDWIINPEIRAEIDQIFAEEGVQTHINTEQAV